MNITRTIGITRIGTLHPHAGRSDLDGISGPLYRESESGALFWGSFDLACTRFSGRLAAPRTGAPNVADHVTLEAYSHEVSSCGFWPGGDGIEMPAFYSYAYIRSHRASPKRPFGRMAHSIVKSSDSSSCRTTSCGRRARPTKLCSSSCKAPTKLRPRWRVGIVPPWSARRPFNGRRK